MTRDQTKPIEEHGRREAQPSTNNRGDAYFDLVANAELLPAPARTATPYGYTHTNDDPDGARRSSITGETAESWMARTDRETLLTPISEAL